MMAPLSPEQLSAWSGRRPGQRGWQDRPGCSIGSQGDKPAGPTRPQAPSWRSLEQGRSGLESAEKSGGRPQQTEGIESPETGGGRQGEEGGEGRGQRVSRSGRLKRNGRKDSRKAGLVWRPGSPEEEAFQRGSRAQRGQERLGVPWLRVLVLSSGFGEPRRAASGKLRGKTVMGVGRGNRDGERRRFFKEGTRVRECACVCVCMHVCARQRDGMGGVKRFL